MAAPAGNQNARKHGMYATPAKQGDRGGMRYSLAAGEVGDACKSQKNSADTFRQHLEDAVLLATGGEADVRIVENEKGEKKTVMTITGGQITLTAAAIIESATKWQRHGRLATKWLNEQYETLTPEQRLSFSREAAKASESRDKCIRALGLPDPIPLANGSGFDYDAFLRDPSRFPALDGQQDIQDAAERDETPNPTETAANDDNAPETRTGPRSNESEN